MFRIKDAKIISKNQNTYLLDVKLCKRKGYKYFEYIENSTYLKRNDKTLKQLDVKSLDYLKELIFGYSKRIKKIIREFNKIKYNDHLFVFYEVIKGGMVNCLIIKNKEIKIYDGIYLLNLFDIIYDYKDFDYKNDLIYKNAIATNDLYLAYNILNIYDYIDNDKLLYLEKIDKIIRIPRVESDSRYLIRSDNFPYEIFKASGFKFTHQMTFLGGLSYNGYYDIDLNEKKIVDHSCKALGYVRVNNIDELYKIINSLFLKMWYNSGVEIHLNFNRRKIIMSQRFMLNETSYHGAGAIQNIVPEAKARGFKKALVCSDPDLVKFGVTKKVTDLLDAGNVSYELYTNIKPNPTIENVTSGVSACKNAGADFIIAIGGGSSMDTAKAIGIIMTNPEFADVRSLEGTAPTKKPCLPIIAVATTAGTAAEVTINYVITDVEKKRKFVCVDPHDMPIVAIVDPDMMASMPKGLTASTGMDALTHAIEGYITRGAWEMSDMFHLKAIELISKNLRGAVNNTKEGREGMALGQYIAGMGFSNVGLGIDHAMAHTLSAYYDIPHGVACAMLLPIAMEFNADVTGEKYKDIAKAMGVNVDGMNELEYRNAAINAVKKLSKDVGIPTKCDKILASDLDNLATDALHDACYPGNPKEASHDDVVDLFKKLM